MKRATRVLGLATIVNRKIMRQQITGTGLCVLAFLVAAPCSRASIIGEFGAHAQASAMFTDSSLDPPYRVQNSDETGGSLETDAYAYADALGNTSWALASLASGYLRAYGSTVPAIEGNPDAWMGATASASSMAEMADLIWFDIPTGSLGELVPYEIELSGSLSGRSRAVVVWDVNGERGVYEAGSGATPPSGTLIVGANTSFYTMMIQVSGWATAGSGDGSTGVYDLGHTVRFKVLLPPGVTGHSASGVLPFYDASGNLIGAPEAAVPEPSTVSLLMSAVGLLALRWLGRKAHRG